MTDFILIGTRRDNAGLDGERRAREATYRFMSIMAGDEPGFEEATRALFAGDEKGFRQRIQAWPVDVRDHARALATVAFQGKAARGARAPRGLKAARATNPRWCRSVPGSTSND